MKTPVVSYEAEHPFNFGQARDNISTVMLIARMLRLQKSHCSAILNNTDIMNYLKSIDLLVTDRSLFCGSLISMAIGKSHVVLSPGAMNMPQRLLSNPFPLSYIPHTFTEYVSKMTFKERFMNTIIYVVGDVIFSYISTSVIGTLNYEFNIDTSKSNYEIENSPSMVLITADFALEYPRPLLPNVKVIGPINAKPAKSLPSDLEAFVNGERKVVYIAFGSVLNEFSQDKMKVFIDAINRLPYKVLWKSKSNSSNLGSHVKTIGWGPQNDILGHKNVIAFFSHCGHNGMYEAAYHGVPVLGMPVYGDQFDNIRQIEHAGFGIRVNFVKLTADDIVNGITEVVKDRLVISLSTVMKIRFIQITKFSIFRNKLYKYNVLL